MDTIKYAKGPQPVGFIRYRTKYCPVLIEEHVCDYPVSRGSSLCEKPKVIPGRKYFNMKLEDFEDYQALGEPLVLHGPAPYHATFCGCNRYEVSSQGCVCSMACREKPFYTWAMQNPDRFQEKQKEMHRWRHLWTIWDQQKDKISSEWYYISKNARWRFEQLQDDESPIGCAQCERNAYKRCCCACDECGSKRCSGCRDYDDDYY